MDYNTKILSELKIQINLPCYKIDMPLFLIMGEKKLKPLIFVRTTKTSMFNCQYNFLFNNNVIIRVDVNIQLKVKLTSSISLHQRFLIYFTFILL